MYNPAFTISTNDDHVQHRNLEDRKRNSLGMQSTVTRMSVFDNLVFAAPSELSSALFDAITADDDTEVFRLAESLLAKGRVLEELSDPAGKGYNPLHFAVSGDKAKAVRALCQVGLSVEARTVAGQNAVHIAVTHRSTAAVRVLCDFGGQAAFCAQDRNGATPHDLTDPTDDEMLRFVGEDECRFSREDIDVSMLDSRARVDALVRAIEGNSPATIIALAETGFAFNEPLNLSHAADFPIHRVAGLRDRALEVAEALCAKGASTEVVNSAGENAIHIAARAGNTAMVKVFAQYGGFAATVARNHHGETPRDVALALSDQHPNDARFTEIAAIFGGVSNLAESSL
jgi:ankyrin repeat protein